MGRPPLAKHSLSVKQVPFMTLVEVDIDRMQGLGRANIGALNGMELLVMVFKPEALTD